MTPNEDVHAAAVRELRDHLGRPSGAWRGRLYDIIFESDTRAGWTFDIVLMLVIVASAFVVMLDSVA